jgi:RNA polymerase sigma-70 factor (ECF subfamily)
LLPKRQISGTEAGERDLPVEDHALVAQVKAGQTQSYGELVRRYQDRIFNTCWRICGHLEDARDLTQDAFLKAFESLDGYREESGFYTWIFRVATNLAISHRRSAGRKRALLDGQANVIRSQADALVRRMEQSVADTSDDARDAATRVAALLQTLDDEQRAVVVLRDIEGFDYQQIGAILDVPTGTVKSRLHRARMALRDAIVRAGHDSRRT